MRYVGFDSFFNRIVVKINGVVFLYRFKIAEYLLVLLFFISIFVSFFINNGAYFLKQKVDEKVDELQKEKDKIDKIEKDQNNRLMIL